MVNMQNKPLVLFGSYGWGGGKYMRDWEETMKKMGVKLLSSVYVTRIE